VIERLFNHARVLHQDDDEGGNEIPNDAIHFSIDAGGTFVVSQRGRHICVNWASVPEFIKLLKIMSDINAKSLKDEKNDAGKPVRR